MATVADNFLLRVLGPNDAPFISGLTAVSVAMGDVLFDAGEALRYAYFPARGTMISMIRTLKRGETSEVGIVGWEGLVGVSCVMRGSVHQYRGLVQSSGTVFRARCEDLRSEFDRGGSLCDLVLRYLNALLNQLAQTAVCNRLHYVEQRLARWLLIVHDHVLRDEIPMTHEFIAHMLGIRRPGVTTAIATLSVDGVIDHRRNSITIRNRRALETISCECYEAVREELQRSLGIEL